MAILLCLFGAMIAGAVLASKSGVGLEAVKAPMEASLAAYDPAKSASGDGEKAWGAVQGGSSIDLSHFIGQYCGHLPGWFWGHFFDTIQQRIGIGPKSMFLEVYAHNFFQCHIRPLLGPFFG